VNEDLRDVGETELHYDQFLGDVVFRVDDLDVSALWGRIPGIDFAACLNRIAEELQPNRKELWSRGQHPNQYADR